MDRDALTGRAARTDSALHAGYESLSGFNEAFQRFAGGPPTRRRDSVVVHVRRIATPLGPMIAATTDRHLVFLEFADRRMVPTQFRRLGKVFHCVFDPNESPIHKTLMRQLGQYFAGRRMEFDIPIAVPGTPFQTRVWDALRRIPAGQTRSYSEVAAAIGRPTAVRAVARANGDNRVAILIPCHRVIGSDGKLVGYGGGLWRKRRLLELEAKGLAAAGA